MTTSIDIIESIVIAVGRSDISYGPGRRIKWWLDEHTSRPLTQAEKKWLRWLVDPKGHVTTEATYGGRGFYRLTDEGWRRWGSDLFVAGVQR